MPGEAAHPTGATSRDVAGNAVGQASHQSDGDASAGTVSVTGTGSAEAAPDLMVVSIGVECRADSVAAAWQRAGSSSDAVASTFRRHGVAGADIRTTGLNVRADLVWREGEGQSVTGYVAASSLTVRLRTPASASAAISEAVEAGGNDVRLNGLDLTFADDAEVRARARDAAWEDALRSAGQFARLASARLGPVLSITDTVGPQPPAPLPRMQRAASVEALGVEAGETAVSVAIRVVWELDY
ncbi:SIMPL domain-containing protein [Arthrobacter sp. OV608]|uniref:SIMPL domain-containing protein n=1 Tax=Arthrobacter sp. OV608 TaxID=1882768 RepID=UPI0008C0BD7B|nr:SIMPL domain-containing protein [Arthrobacter sp. OV608]SEQ11724.1 hypothetical protein SAMN05444745_10421 [Arthrobacter sp. OV608]